MSLKIRVSLFFLFFFGYATCWSQTIIDSISKDYIEKTITWLASDELGGRVNFSREQLVAAEFLSGEFTKAGLQPYPGYSNFFIPFRTTWGKKSDGGDLYINGEKINDSLFIFIQHQLAIPKRNLQDFMVLQAMPPLAESLLYNNWENKQNNILLWIPLTDSISFSEALKDVMLPTGVPASDILIVASREEPTELKFTGNKKQVNSELYNVVSVLPGRSLPDEAIIFSAHYDHVDHDIDGVHLGIFNGANDDASGTTAVLALAKYFSMKKDNERTLIFCLFAGEELGLYGSKAFVNLIKPESVKAVINIEMIGRTNAVGKNAVMVTGSSLSSLAAILRKNIKGEKTKVKDMPGDPNFLFQRSDNYPFAQEGIPAHSLMCSDDHDPCYHQPCDDVDGIDIENMTTIIRAIAKSCLTLISGRDTPTRIKN